MLKKFITIKNIGRFGDFSAKGELEFHRLNLIYGENSLGKSTLCAILRSLNDNNPIFITERHTLGKSDKPYVELRIETGNAKFTGDLWEGEHPSIVSFDQHFINRNVYSGQTVDSDHKRELYHVVIGEEGVELENEVQRFVEQQKNVTDNITRLEKTIRGKLPSSINLEEFLTWQIDDRIDEKIKEKEAEIASKEKSDEIKSKPMLAELNFPILPTSFIPILEKTIADIEHNAEMLVQEHIKNYEMTKEGENWVTYGLDHAKDGYCPFCGQSIDSLSIISAYRSFFNNQYKNLKNQIESISEAIESAIGDKMIGKLHTIFLSNEGLLQFWGQFENVSDIILSWDNLEALFSKLYDMAKGLLDEKRNHPLDIVSTNNTWESCITEFEKLKVTVEQYNDVIRLLNEKIKKLKTSFQDIGKLRTELQQLKAKKIRFGTELETDCETLNTEKNKKINIESQKNEAKKKLDEYNESVVGKFETDINKYLHKFNANFSIAGFKSDYKSGGKPRTDYKIKVNGVSCATGDSKAAGQPRFETLLSSGDCASLALAFFLASLDADTKLNERIVVFDDPLASMDKSRRTSTIHVLGEIAQKAKQTIVLSHDPFFLYEIYDNYHNGTNNIRYFQVRFNGTNSELTTWNMKDDTQSIHIKHYRILKEYLTGRQTSPEQVATLIRPFLEGVLRIRFPDYFLGNEWLGQFLDKLREADPNTSFGKFKQYHKELSEINDYSKSFHHSSNPSSSQIINTEELHGYIRRTLCFVNGDI